MPDNRLIHIKKACVDYSTLDSQGKLKIVSILNFLQDAASEHASKMGVSGFDLAEKDLAWVIVRYQIELKLTPVWREKLKIETWRTPLKNLYELRQFRITGSNGLEILTARALWVMIRRKNNRPVRLSRYMPDRFLKETTTEDTPNFDKLNLPLKTDLELPFKVRMHDLDLNGHVNNAIYLEWAVETVPQHILLTHQPKTLEVVFQRESLYGDKILSRTEIITLDDRLMTRHLIMDTKTDMERARINIMWKITD